MEGQTTSHVVADKLEEFENLNVTRLAQGVPIGGEVHFLDENTLNTAFQSRKKIINYYGKNFICSHPIFVKKQSY